MTSVSVGCWGLLGGNEKEVVDSEAEWEALNNICAGAYYGWSDSQSDIMLMQDGRHHRRRNLVYVLPLRLLPTLWCFLSMNFHILVRRSLVQAWGCDARNRLRRTKHKLSFWPCFAVVEDLNKRRQPLPALEAVYFIQPSHDRWYDLIDKPVMKTFQCLLAWLGTGLFYTHLHDLTELCMRRRFRCASEFS